MFQIISSVETSPTNNSSSINSDSNNTSTNNSNEKLLVTESLESSNTELLNDELSTESDNDDQILQQIKNFYTVCLVLNQNLFNYFNDFYDLFSTLIFKPILK